MKRISFFVLLTSAITTFSVSSCDKDELTPSVRISSINAAPDPYTFDLVADHWNNIVPGVYSCSFINIIPPGYRNGRSVMVYLLNADQKTQIDNPINFMGGELSAITNTSDVTINFRYFRELPFDHLKIKVEIK